MGIQIALENTDKSFYSLCSQKMSSKKTYISRPITSSASVSLVSESIENIQKLMTLIEAFDARYQTSTLFFDLSDALECVYHDILLKKLEYCSFYQNCIQLIKSYLAERTQVVKVDRLSSIRTFIIEVPQSQIIGPLLVLISVNYSYLSDQSSRFPLFADDTTIAVRAVHKMWFSKGYLRHGE